MTWLPGGSYRVLTFRDQINSRRCAEIYFTVPILPIVFNGSMETAKIIPFPLERRYKLRSCPHCGKRSDVWQIGQLLWGYCDQHVVRWVVADYHQVSRATINRREMRQGLEFLATFVEVSA